MRPFVYTDQIRYQVLVHVLTRGWAPTPTAIAAELHLRPQHAECALEELRADGWLIDSPLHSGRPELNRNRPGFAAFTRWLYIEDGIHVAPPRDRFRHGPLTRHQPPLVEVAADVTDEMVTARQMRTLRMDLHDLRTRHPLWEPLMQDVYARDRNERARDLIHLHLHDGSLLADADELLDETDDTTPGRAQRWASALAAIGRALVYVQDTVDRLARSYDRSRDLARAVESWAYDSGALPTLMAPFSGYTAGHATTRANFIRALQQGGFERGGDYRHGGTPATTDVGSVGEIVVAADLVAFGQELRKLALTAAGSNPIAENLVFSEVTLPPLERRYPDLPAAETTTYSTPPEDAAPLTIEPVELRAGDYLLRIGGRALIAPVLLLTDPDGPLGAFKAAGPNPRTQGDQEERVTVWTGWTAAMEHDRVEIVRPT